MPSESLEPLFSPIIGLPDMRRAFGQRLVKLCGERVLDLLWHFPHNLIDRRFTPKIRDILVGEIVTVTVCVVEHRFPLSSLHPIRIFCQDETGFLEVVFFQSNREYLKRCLPIGKTVVLSGKVSAYSQRLQIIHPHHIGTIEERDSIEVVEPHYRLTAHLASKTVRKAIKNALSLIPEHLPEWLHPDTMKRYNWPSWKEALQTVHHPQSKEDLLPLASARARIAFDELLASQIIVAYTYLSAKRNKQPLGKPGALYQHMYHSLPFKLTASQEAAIHDILADLTSSRRMIRLLQGDVGSGKTVVAFLAMIKAVECGFQAVMMAPTEVLVQQHFKVFTQWTEKSTLKISILTGSHKGKKRHALLDSLKQGDINILIGTHALFQSEVTFHKLGLVVIDEQHRFGVHQRFVLSQKGESTDVLVMTATPIPRTLMLSLFGPIVSSRMAEKPKGRLPIDTRMIPLTDLDKVIQAVVRKVQKHEQVYWVCPLVEESEKVDVMAAEERYTVLKTYIQEVSLLHGRMTADQKQTVLMAFNNGTASVLVTTTVVELGLDVSAATVMIIEHAERFGLAQLHQLRGRVGRSSLPSTCLLLYEPGLNPIAKSRLEILRKTEDGFRIAEEDLRLRNAGDILGTKQSGRPNFRLADLNVHGFLLEEARQDAHHVVEQDPKLLSPRGQALRLLLQLYDYKSVVTYLNSG